MKIITGYTGTDHVNAEDDAQLHRGVFGAGNYVLSDGNKLGYELLANNMIRIRDGGIIYNGVHALIENYEDVQIANGQQGITRTDMLVARYAKDGLTDIASVALVMITGSANAAATPLPNDFPLYRITLNGVNISTVTPLFNVLMPMEDIVTYIGKQIEALAATLRKEINTASTKASNNLENAVDALEGNIEQASSEASNNLKSAVNTLNKAIENSNIELKNYVNGHINSLQGQIDTINQQLRNLM